MPPLTKSRRKPPKARYQGRSSGIVPCTIALTREARLLLEELAPSSYSFGRFLSELVMAEQARREERQRCRAALLALATTLEDTDTEPVRSGRD